MNPESSKTAESTAPAPKLTKEEQSYQSSSNVLGKAQTRAEQQQIDAPKLLLSAKGRDTGARLSSMETESQTNEIKQQKINNKDKEEAEKAIATAQKEQERAAFKLVGRQPNSSLITEEVRAQATAYQARHPKADAQAKGASFKFKASTLKSALNVFGKSNAARSSAEPSVQSSHHPSRENVTDRPR